MTEAELRPTRLGWSALCFALFAVLALLVALEWSPLLDLDADLGAWPESFTREHDGVYEFWHCAVDRHRRPCRGRRSPRSWRPPCAAQVHRRAAIWTVGVMATVGAADRSAQAARSTGSDRSGTSRSLVLQQLLLPLRPLPPASPARSAWRSCSPRCWSAGAAYDGWCSALALAVGPAGRRRPDLPRRAQRLRRGRRLPPRRRRGAGLAGLLRPDAAVDRAGQRAAARGRARTSARSWR